MTAVEIVQQLAQHPEPLQYATQRCALCNMHADGTGQNHSPQCAYRQAKEWVAANSPVEEAAPAPVDVPVAGDDLPPVDAPAADTPGDPTSADLDAVSDDQAAADLGEPHHGHD